MLKYQILLQLFNLCRWSNLILTYTDDNAIGKVIIVKRLFSNSKNSIIITRREQSTLFREHEKEKVNIVIGRLK